MESVGKMLVMTGVILALVGLFFWLGAGKERGGFLPGDIFVDKGNVKFYFPIVTCLVISAVLSLLFWLFRR